MLLFPTILTNNVHRLIFLNKKEERSNMIIDKRSKILYNVSTYWAFALKN